MPNPSAVKPAEERDHEHQRRVAEHRNPPQHPHHEDRHARDHRDRCADDAEKHQHPDRQVGEAEDAVDRITELASERPAAAPFEAGLPIVGHEPAAEADPEDKRHQAGMRLAEFSQPCRDLPGAAEHVDAATRHVADDEAPVQPPETVRHPPRPPRIRSRASNSKHDVRFVVRQEAMEFERQRRRFLEIRGHHDHVLAGGMLQSGGDRGERPEVPAQLHESAGDPPFGQVRLQGTRANRRLRRRRRTRPREERVTAPKMCRARATGAEDSPGCCRRE